MARFAVEIRVRFKDGILDPQAEAVETALKRLKFDQVVTVSVEKAFVLTIEAASPGEALALGRSMARDLLANIVMEDFDIRLVKDES